MSQRCPSRGGQGTGGQLPPPLFLADQLTLFEPRGHIMPTTLLPAPPDFWTVRRLCVHIGRDSLVLQPHRKLL